MRIRSKKSQKNNSGKLSQEAIVMQNPISGRWFGQSWLKVHASQQVLEARVRAPSVESRFKIEVRATSETRDSVVRRSVNIQVASRNYVARVVLLYFVKQLVVCHGTSVHLMVEN